jgi:hypothetical protein
LVKIISLSKPITWHGSQLTEIGLKEPTGLQYIRLGEPRLAIASGTGGLGGTTTGDPGLFRGADRPRGPRRAPRADGHGRREKAQGSALRFFPRGVGDGLKVAVGDLVFRLKAVSLDAAAAKPISELFALHKLAAWSAPQKKGGSYAS